MGKEFRFYSEFHRIEESIFDFAKKLNKAFLDFSKYDERFGLLIALLPNENKTITLNNHDSSILEIAKANYIIIV